MVPKPRDRFERFVVFEIMFEAYESKNVFFKVSCGGHSASNCGNCIYNGAQYMGPGWCNGECTWLSGNCVPKDTVGMFQ